jgi:hypothetical protein
VRDVGERDVDELNVVDVLDAENEMLRTRC